MLSINRLSSFKFSSGPVEFVPTRVTSKGFDCICGTDLTPYQAKKIGIQCADTQGQNLILDATVLSVAYQGGVFVISFELDEKSFYSLMEKAQ